MKKILSRAKQEIAYYRALFIHPRTPRLSRWLLGGAIAYLASPADIIPDFIPILGQLDDLLIVPGLMGAALALIPASVKIECREKMANHAAEAVSCGSPSRNPDPEPEKGQGPAEEAGGAAP
ncbi:MAG: DUF1232 domain-containing protein [Lentisphaerae bacterium]|nr:DUF1232 domain-containing protein [Lentisphaerota bacterium]